MQYEMMNMKFGHKIIATSEASRDKILSGSKKWNGNPVWKLHREIPDPVKTKTVAVEEDSLAELKAEYEEVVGKKPHHKLSAERMALEIENAR